MAREFTTENGHKFIVEGETSVGNYIRVTVIPSSGYVFDGWEFDYFMQPIDQDNDGNPIYKIKVNECGVRLIGRFEPITEPCDKEKIYYALCEIIGEECENYEVSNITCEEINRILGEIIGEGEETARLTVVSDDDNMGNVNIDGNGSEIEGMVGDTYNINAEPTDCCNFEKWVDENGRTYNDNPKSVTLTTNKRYTAYFSKRELFLKFEPISMLTTVTVYYSIDGIENNFELTDSVKTLPIKCGSNVQVWVDKEIKGYKFNKWSGDYSTNNNLISIDNINSNYTITPNYNINEYSIIVYPPVGINNCQIEYQIGTDKQTISLNDSNGFEIKLKYHDDIIFRYKDINGYSFNGWIYNPNSGINVQNNELQIKDIEQDYTEIRPTYKRSQVTITVVKPDNVNDATITYNGQTLSLSDNRSFLVTIGSNIVITANQTGGYECYDWWTDGNNTYVVQDNEISFTVNNSCTVKPLYRILEYTVTTTIYDPGVYQLYDVRQGLVGDDTLNGGSFELNMNYTAGSNVQIMGDSIDFEGWFKEVNGEWKFLSLDNPYIINNLQENVKIGGSFGIPDSNRVQIRIMGNNRLVSVNDLSNNNFIYDIKWTNGGYIINYSDGYTFYNTDVLKEYRTTTKVPLCFQIKSRVEGNNIPLIECRGVNDSGNSDHRWTGVLNSYCEWEQTNNLLEGNLQVSVYNIGSPNQGIWINFLRYNLTYNISVYGYTSSPNVMEYDITTSNYNFSVSILNYDGNGEEKYVITPNNSTNTNVVSMGKTSILSDYGIHFKLRCTGVTPNASGNVIIPVYGKYLQENGEWVNLTLASIPNDTARWNQVSGSNDTYEYEVIIPSSNWVGLDNNGNYIRNIKLQINTQYI